MAYRQCSLEGVGSMNADFWRGKRVLVTGHTGFKGSWLSLWLSELGAEVTGFALPPPTETNLFNIIDLSDSIRSQIGDIRDATLVSNIIKVAQPEIIFHMAAQPLVRYSYQNPVETYHTNVMGTVHLLDAIRQVDTVRAVINVTTDKCYENREWVWGYRENEPMGGFDPYSSSKGCSELLTASFRNSFFPADRYSEHKTAIASARAGNVIGGGDWADERLIPDIIKAIVTNKTVKIRSPHAIRPWQHVLEPLSGYLLLAETLYNEGSAYAEGWNFGPADSDARPVGWIVERLTKLWGPGATWVCDQEMQPHEAQYLKLDCSKARQRLNWQARWSLDTTLERIVSWHKAYESSQNMRQMTLNDILDFTNSPLEKSEI